MKPEYALWEQTVPDVTSRRDRRRHIAQGSKRLTTRTYSRVW